MNKKLWIWEWKDFGYNYCYAESREKALRQANELASQYKHLQVDEFTLREGSEADLGKMAELYSSMFD
jgi:hypothetical protein